MIEIVIASVAVVGVLATGTGLILSWHKNGTAQAARDLAHAEAQAARDAVAQRNQAAILGRLDDKESGLQAVNIKVGEIVTTCAVHEERLTGHDREIKELKQKS